MALQVWLPLRGDLNNYGLSDVSVANNGGNPTFTDGKIGKGLSCPGNFNWKISTITLESEASITWWSKTTVNGKMPWVLECTTSNYLNFYEASIYTLNIGDGNNNPFQNNGTNINVLHDGLWHHFAVIWKDSKVLLYIDGLYSGTAKTFRNPTCTNRIIKLAGDFNGGHSYDWNGMLNDFRIYNHALSPKEVKEISLGLVLHYKLDNPYTENTTNLSTLGNCSGWNNSGTATRTNNDTSLSDIPEPSGKTVSILENTDGLCAITFGTTTVNVPSKTLTASVWIYISGDVTSSISPYIRSSKTDGNIGNLEYNNLSSIGSWPKNTWIRITKTLTTNSEATTIYFCAYIAKTGCKLTFNGWQIEEKDHVTPYVNGTRTENVIYDSSGYGNNGIITGNISSVTDSSRYNQALHFINGSYIRVEGRPVDILPKDAITVNIWSKHSTWGNPISCTEGGGWNFENSNGILFPLYVQSVGYKVANSGVSVASLANSWHMITGTFDRTNVKIYIDGELKGTTATGSTNGIGYANNYLFISAEALGNYVTPNSSANIGDISDVRIYATALSAEDILNLYQVNASIDNGGNIISNEFEEEYTSKQQILKTGVVKIDNFLEINDKLKVLSDGSVFLLILHHNAPASNLFTSSNCWLNNDTNLYSALILLKNASWLQNLSEYEFLVCEKGTSSGTEHQCRWKQTSNPALSSTLSGYSVISGNSTRSWGLMNKNSYGCFHNGSIWWCCCGSYTAFNGGIPGFEDTVTTGYLDLYVKIPNEMIKGNIADFVKFYAKSILTNQLIEK